MKIYTTLKPQREILCTMDKTSLVVSVFQPVELYLSFSWTTSPKHLSLALPEFGRTECINDWREI